MPFHDSIKPVIGTSLLVLYLPVPPYLLLLHGLHGMWRRIGAASYVFLMSAYVLFVFLVVRFHSLWAWHAWAWPDAVAWTGLVPLGLAGWLAVETYRTIEPATLHLVHQIRGTDRRLITDGILGRMRHPRYVMFTLIAVGNALVTGYPLVLASLAFSALLFWVVIRLEERELRAHFGEAFDVYRRRVPAFFPRRMRD